MKKIWLLLKRRRRIFQGILGLVLLATLIWRSDPKLIYSHLMDAPIGFLIPWIVTYTIATVVAWGIGIYCLLRRIRSGGVMTLLAVSFKLQVLSTVIPGRLGDLGMLYFLKDRYSYGQTSAVFLTDKIITLIVNFLLSIIGMAVFYSLRFSMLAGIALLLCMTFVLWFSLKFPSRFFRLNFFENIINKLQGFRFELHASLKDAKGLVGNFVMTVLRYLSAGVSMLLILKCFHTDAPLFQIILIQAIAQLATFVPLTTMGIGIQEAVHVFLFGNLGVSPEIILAANIWSRAIYIAFMGVVYFFWIWSSNRSKIDLENKESGSPQ